MAALLAPFVGFSLVALFSAWRKSIWVDEAYSIDTATRALAAVLSQTRHFELQPPLYFLLLHAWSQLGTSAIWLRLLSIVAVILAALCLYRCLALLGRPLGRLGGLVLVLACPRMLAAAVEIRGYGLSLLLSAALLLCVLRVWFVADRPRAWMLPCTFAVAWLGIQASYYAGFVFGGLVLAAWRTGRHRRELLVGTACVGLALLPQVPIILAQAAQHPIAPGGKAAELTAGLAASPLRDAVTRVVAALIDAAGSLLASPLSERWVVLLSAPLLLCWCVWHVLVRRRERSSDEAAAAIALATAIALGALLLLGLSGISLVQARHLTVIVPGLLLVLASFVGEAERSRPSRRIAGTLLAGYFLAGHVSLQRNLSPTDFKAVASRIVHDADGNDPILAFPSFLALPLRYSLPDERAVGGIPADIALVAYPLDDQMRVASAEEAWRRIARLGGDGGVAFWLVSQADLPTPGAAFVEEAIQARCRIDADTTIVPTRVRHARCTGT